MKKIKQTAVIAALLMSMFMMPINTYAESSGSTSVTIQMASDQNDSHKDPIQTGDSTNVYLWAGLGVSSTLILIGMLLVKHKSDKESE